jgi:hypothetical protein
MTAELEKNAADPQNSQTDPKNKEHDTFERVTLATAIAGVILLTIYTGLTAYQAAIAKDTAERQLRAYISVVVEKQPDLNGSGPPNAIILFKNTGQTPAYSVRAHSVFSVLNGDTISDAQVKDIRDYMATLKGFESAMFPGQEFRQSAEPAKGIPLTENQKILISMGAMTLWVNGEVVYEDAFGHPHFTHFRLFMNGEEGNRYDRLIWAEHGNDAN